MQFRLARPSLQLVNRAFKKRSGASQAFEAPAPACLEEGVPVKLQGQCAPSDEPGRLRGLSETSEPEGVAKDGTHYLQKHGVVEARLSKKYSNIKQNGNVENSDARENSWGINQRLMKE